MTNASNTPNALNGNTEISHIEFNSANFKWTLHQRINGCLINTELSADNAHLLIKGLSLSPENGTITWDLIKEGKGGDAKVADRHIVYYSFPHLQENGDYVGPQFKNPYA